MSELFTDEATHHIQKIIQKNPGITLSKIAELLNMKVVTVEHCLSQLQKKGELQITLDEGFIRYYHKETRQNFDEKRNIETRQKIHALIMNNPGLHLSIIAKQLNMSIPLVEYHLSRMEKDHQLKSVKGVGGYYKRFYLQGSEVGVKEATLLALLRQKTPLQIVLLLWKNPRIQHKDILEKLSISKSTLTYQLDKLIEYGIVEQNHSGEEKGYILKNEQELIWIIRRYKLDQTLDRFKDLWSNLDI
jgi:predicted transcriptional regulator